LHSPSEEIAKMQGLKLWGSAEHIMEMMVYNFTTTIKPYRFLDWSNLGLRSKGRGLRSRTHDGVLFPLLRNGGAGTPAGKVSSAHLSTKHLENFQHPSVSFAPPP